MTVARLMVNPLPAIAFVLLVLATGCLGDTQTDSSDRERSTRPPRTRTASDSGEDRVSLRSLLLGIEPEATAVPTPSAPTETLALSYEDQPAATLAQPQPAPTAASQRPATTSAQQQTQQPPPTPVSQRAAPRPAPQPTAPIARSLPAPEKADWEALQALYHSTDGSNWKNDTNWLSSAPIGQWYGVQTNTEGRVFSIDLSGNGLRGEIPPKLANARDLVDLRLSENNLTGEIPSMLGQLVNLQVLKLDENQLSGSIARGVRVSYLTWGTCIFPKINCQGGLRFHWTTSAICGGWALVTTNSAARSRQSWGSLLDSRSWACPTTIFLERYRRNSPIYGDWTFLKSDTTG